MSTIINRKTAAKAGLVARLGALAAAPVIAAAKAARYSSRYGDDYSISCSSDYYWRRWQLPRRNRLLHRLLLLQQRLGRLLNIGAATPRHKARRAQAWEGQHIARGAAHPLAVEMKTTLLVEIVKRPDLGEVSAR
jgi:hypothetical protein